MILRRLVSPNDLEQLFTEFHEKLYKYLYLRCGRHRETAEDMTQQVFYKAWKKREQYCPSKSSVQNWLYAIARNEVVDYYRSSEKKFQQLSEPDESAICTESNEREVLLSQVLSRVELLSPDEKELIILHYIQGLAPRDISRILGITYIATKVRIHRALSKLKQLMEVNHEAK